MLALTRVVPCVWHRQRRQGMRAELVEESEDVEQERCFRVRGHTEVVRRAAARATAIGNKTTCGLIIVISRGDHLTRDLTK